MEDFLLPSRPPSLPSFLFLFLIFFLPWISQSLFGPFLNPGLRKYPWKHSRFPLSCDPPAPSWKNYTQEFHPKLRYGIALTLFSQQPPGYISSNLYTRHYVTCILKRTSTKRWSRMSQRRHTLIHLSMNITSWTVQQALVQSQIGVMFNGFSMKPCYFDGRKPKRMAVLWWAWTSVY